MERTYLNNKMNTFRTKYIFPIYNILRMKEFHYENEFSNIKFKINLQTYEEGKNHYDEWLKVFDTEDKKLVYELFDLVKKQETIYRYSESKTLLVIDFETQYFSNEVDDIKSFEENEKKFNYSVILRSILETLNLILPYGLGYYKYISKENNLYLSLPFHEGNTNFFNGFQVHTPHEKPYSFSPLVDFRLMRLKKEDFNQFESVLLRVYGLNTEKLNQYSRIIKQSIDYLQLAKTFLNSEQVFVTLMIAIEAMFKKEQDKKLATYIKWIGKLLQKENNRGKIHKAVDDFIPLRNNIVHGDEFLDKNEMDKKVLELYEYVRQCILAIMEINSKKELVNYYDDLFKEVEKEYLEKISKISPSKQ
ncbi:HEPN domain-containing protein [Arcobacter arenosus]|uniref:Uncharacterized protein n=1 Tax=Arcobacter arenosus TaxID=2576037 RepID=A0A5R8Y2H4_9BACT|nr:HEPN domain-containing protein [Arcobacter arenosus]TLP39151.1 hypothetical protein FDK22_04575 [Arcobacter arenosus]